MSKVPIRNLSEAIKVDIDSVTIDPAASYDIAGVYSFGRGVFTRGKITGSDTSYQRLHRLKSGQVVMSRLKAFEGAISLVPAELHDSYLSPEFPTFSVLPEADPRYISYLCQWPDFWGMLARKSKGLGSRRERVQAENLLSLSVPLPSRVEQGRIADKLDSTVSCVDSIAERRVRMGALQGSLAESLITSAVSGASESVRVGEVLAFKRTPADIDSAGTYRTIGIRSFGRGIIHHPSVSRDGLSKLSYFTFPQGALALSNLMAWEGGISVTQAEDAEYIASNRFFFYLPVDDRVNTSYLRHFLLSKQGLALVGSACSAGAERNRTLGRKRFEALTIPLPPRSVQDRIASTLDRLTERLNSAYAEPSLAALRPSILNAAFTGQL
ncbi:restriction endonuclease subunit S [Streptomyces albus]|uniref:restriction endonuclease subunit S n=1 Tax=Streptomyces albus TaxID=1888 RepID=UPI003F1B2305